LRPFRKTRNWIFDDRKVSSVEGIFAKTELRANEDMVELSHVFGQCFDADQPAGVRLLDLL
jgi:hypothetical protein